MSNQVDFKLIMPLEKSESSDGSWRIKGLAASIDVDRENDALTPEALQGLADQINTAPLPLRNHHKVDDITEDIGEVYKAEVTAGRQLWVEAELDQDNPFAQYLWKKLGQNKQYGLSLRGSTVGYYGEIEKSTGKRIRRHPFVIGREFSVTTRPVLAQTFGTVLQKAISESSPEGDSTEMSDTLKTGAQEVQKSESSAPENDTTQAQLSPSDELVKSLMANADFVTLIKTTVGEAVSASTQVEQESSEEDSTEISKSEQADTTPDVAELVKSAVSEATAAFAAQLNALADRIPEVSPPGVLTKSEQESDEEILASIKSDPRQALRVGLAARHGQLDKIR